MLKLARFPRAANRNRTLKQRQGGALATEEDAAQEVARVFRRFWRERLSACGHAQAGTLARTGNPGWTTQEEMGCV